MASRDGHLRRRTLIKQFCSVTGADKDVAKRMLEICNYNVEVAINMHVEADEPSSTSAADSSSTVGVKSVSIKADATTTTATMTSKGASGSASDYDDVRAPIPPTQGVLVGPGYSATALRTRRRLPRSVFDGFRDFEAETRQQEQELWNSSSGEGHGGEIGGSGSSASRHKRKTLEDLFRPPLDVMHKGTFDSARDCGERTNRWLMVNIQNVQEFPCQVLNRDVWSNDAVKSIIKEHFIFWQVYHDSEEGERYMQFYKITTWPYVSVIDPRTGENMITWTKVDSLSFFDLVTEFLTVHPSLDGSSSSAPAVKRQRKESILDASEDSQMEAAIKASLVETVVPIKPSCNNGSGSGHLKKAGQNNNNNNNSRMSSATASKVINNSDDEEEEDDDDYEGMDELETFDTDSEDSNFVDNEVKEESEKKLDTIGKVQNNGDPTEIKSLEVNNGVVAVHSHDESTDDCWEKHIGLSEDPKSSLVIRFPDGSKEQLSLPSTSKLKALVLFVESKGFSQEKFELVTNFPKRRIDTMNVESSLKEVGLFPQETVFVQSR